MGLTVGTRLGPYEIVSALGAGGMGEVYRARDRKLGRDVAIKIVSDGFGQDPERVARLQREAHLLAALNHPHIAAIYGLEEVNGTQFLVLELVEGETLAERLKSGPIPVPEALTVALQVADALQAAHEKGIIHRDLKPANIAFTADGQVKVLDFGLAKAVEAQPAADVSNSPTMTLGATQAGLILGTAAYMSPEQAKGRPADKRSDVWAFGCVLYEMLTGKRAFEGEDVSDTLAAVLRGEPDWNALPADLPPPIRTLVQRCLAKDRKERTADISIAHFVLSESQSSGLSGLSTVPVPPRPMWRRAALPALTWLLGAAMVGTGVWVAMRPTPPHVSRLLITPAADAALMVRTTPIRDIAITPDASKVIYTGPDDLLFVRALGELDARPLTGLGRAVGPFISPDGQWVAFSRQGDIPVNILQRAPIAGGPAIPLVRLDNAFSGGTWGSDGTIVFATANLETGLQRISVDAPENEPTVLTRPDRANGEGDHVFPHFLPSGQAVLFTIRAATGNLDDARVAVLNLRTGTYTTLIRGGTDAQYVSSGHLVYGAAGALRAVAFDLSRLEVVGAPVPAIPELITKGTGGVDAAVAVDGTLVYAPGSVAGVRRAVLWVDRQGRVEPTSVFAGMHDYLQLSPDGTHVALATNDENLDIWVWDLARGTRTRLTTDSLNDRYPVWALDGSRVLFSSGNPGVTTPNIFWRAADGTGTIERLTEGEYGQYPTSLSRDGTLVFQQGAGGNIDILTLTLRDRRIQPLVETPFVERNGEVSPDGQWLAYESNESGQMEVHVRPFPNVQGGRWPVSGAGGTRPVWARDGGELFYIAPSGSVMAVQVERGSAWNAGSPVKLFDWFPPPTEARSYDVAPDGRFLALGPAAIVGPPPADGSDQAAGPSSLVVVQHFDEELKRLVPAN